MQALPKSNFKIHWSDGYINNCSDFWNQKGTKWDPLNQNLIGTLDMKKFPPTRYYIHGRYLPYLSTTYPIDQDK